MSLAILSMRKICWRRAFFAFNIGAGVPFWFVMNNFFVFLNFVRREVIVTVRLKVALVAIEAKFLLVSVKAMVSNLFTSALNVSNMTRQGHSRVTTVVVTSICNFSLVLSSFSCSVV